MVAKSRGWQGRLAAAVGVVGVFLAAGCATTGGGAARGEDRIPEGKGRLVLETGGIERVNYYVLDQGSGEEVYSESPRLSAASPSGYSRAQDYGPQYVDLPAGQYTVVVNTDIRESVEVPDVEVVMGQSRYVRVPVGRFQLLFSSAQGRVQVPFLIYDYGMNEVLGRGMTSTDVRYFIVPEGTYKVRVESTAGAIDEIRPVQVSFGRTQNVTIGPAATEQVPGGVEQQGQGGDQQQ
ncbi:MAG: hypothetical protein AB1505_16825 [Candidatus Latescibacterota bacterium]